MSIIAFSSAASAAESRANPLIARLAEGTPVIGVRTGAIAAPRIAKVLATSDVDFIIADVEHEVYDFNTLRYFLLGVQDFSVATGRAIVRRRA